MKGIENAAKTLRRRWSYNGRICNYHSGCGGLCRTASEHFTFRRSSADAARSDSICNNCPNRKVDSEAGSVTAEFALLVPAALLVLLLSISTFSIQAKRMALVELAAEGARELARGETQTSLDALIAESKLNPSYEIHHQNLLICLKLSTQANLSWLGLLPISESQCARKSGL